jgi:hypothetical protein
MLVNVHTPQSSSHGELKQALLSQIVSRLSILRVISNLLLVEHLLKKDSEPALRDKSLALRLEARLALHQMLYGLYQGELFLSAGAAFDNASSVIDTARLWPIGDSN